MTNLKDAVTSPDAKSHVFNTLQYPSCYVIYHEGKHWLHSIHTGWDKRREYKGHTACLDICSWTVAATLQLPFKVRMLPMSELTCTHDEILRKYG